MVGLGTLAQARKNMMFGFRTSMLRIISFILIVLVLCAGIAAHYLPDITRSTIRTMAIRHTLDTAEQLRAIQEHTLEHHEEAETIPEAATPDEPGDFIHSIMARLNSGNMTIQIFAKGSGTKAEDLFAREAQASLAENPGTPFIREEMTQSGRSIRIAIPDGEKSQGQAAQQRGIITVATNLEADYRVVDRMAQTIRLFVLGLLAVIAGVFFLSLRLMGKHSEKDLTAEEELAFLAGHDAMTGALNRTRFMEELADKLATSGHGKTIFSVLYVDLDRFKDINEALGHTAGDELICAAAIKIRKVITAGDIFARMGGDEFVIAIKGRDPLPLALKLLKTLAEPVVLSGNAVRPGASIGIATGTGGTGDASEFLRRADVALYRAKQQGRGRYALFSPELDLANIQRREMEATVRAALEQDRFELHYQPVWGLQDGALLGFEALVRMRDASDALVPPGQFIPLAEEMGLIVEIGNLVLHKASREAASWPLPLRIAVNLSPAQIRRGKDEQGGSASQNIRSALSESGLDPHRLEVEITEGMLLEDTENVLAELHAIKAMGVEIAMDDFGTGFSSLSYLWKFPFDKLKIDRSFFNVAEDGTSRTISILQKIIELGSALNMRITAEGIEMPEHADMLRRMGCDEVQGFLFGRPMPNTAIGGLILREFQRRNGLLPSSEPVEQPALRAVSA
jgi:diguanylate cyclase (GGDEF)-like protein